ncbi:hypothetical protein EGW08_012878 [Elysia chlorotica]|uniref:Uncharacterized protein n=1 Tax=Elysia chlorotica TaxID=188477 RepID=A0A433TCM9_ELYCH|nr:hypothetical protein EGW08_012878 [Elysia chlorotica]
MYHLGRYKAAGRRSGYAKNSTITTLSTVCGTLGGYAGVATKTKCIKDKSAVRKQHKSVESSKFDAKSQKNKPNCERDNLSRSTNRASGVSSKKTGLSQVFKHSNELCVSKNPINTNINVSKTSIVQDVVGASTAATTIRTQCCAFKPSPNVKPNSFFDRASRKSAIFTQALESGSTETLTLAEAGKETRPLQADEESPDFLNNRSDSFGDITSTPSTTSTLNTAQPPRDSTDCSNVLGITNTNSSSNVNKNARSSGCKGSSGSKTRDSANRAKGERCPSSKKANKTTKTRSASATARTISSATTSTPTKGPPSAETASARATAESSSSNVPANSSTIAATVSSDNDSPAISTGAGISTANAVSSSSSSSSSSIVSSGTPVSTGSSSSTSSGSSLSTMSAMDLLMQLDLPTVSDSSDTEDFLQELAAINDSGSSVGYCVDRRAGRPRFEPQLIAPSQYTYDSLRN